MLPRLVHSRFGLHVVEVLEREAGVTQGFDAVRGAVAEAAGLLRRNDGKNYSPSTIFRSSALAIFSSVERGNSATIRTSRGTLKSARPLRHAAIT